MGKGTIKEERIYLGSYEIYRKFDHTSSLIIERTTVHISDDAGRIAMLETRTYGTAADDNNTAAMLTRYIYSNHLQSASLELDESAAIISYEEYHPYGTTSYQANNAAIKAVAKRYRYTGKERDEESGMYYHGARYYIPWLCRWSASDPINSDWYNLSKGNPNRNHDRHFLEVAASPYEYCLDNPIKNTDPLGEQEVDEVVKKTSSKPKVDPNTLKELTKDLPKGGEQASKELGKEFIEQAEKQAVKTAEKAAEKAATKTAFKTFIKVVSKANIVLDVIQLVLVPQTAHAPSNNTDKLAKEAEAYFAGVLGEFNAAAERIATGVSTIEQEQKKNSNLIFRSMQTINGNWIESPLIGAGNGRQLGARTPQSVQSTNSTVDIRPIEGVVYPDNLSSEGKRQGLSAHTSYTTMLGKLFSDEYKNKPGAIGMFDRRLLIPLGLEAATDSKDGHVTIYPRFTMSIEGYIKALNSIPWVPVFKKK